jgi:hypothetical protein
MNLLYGAIDEYLSDNHPGWHAEHYEYTEHIFIYNHSRLKIRIYYSDDIIEVQTTYTGPYETRLRIEQLLPFIGDTIRRIEQEQH